MSENPNQISISVDEKMVTDLLQKGLTDFFNGSFKKENVAEGISIEQITKAATDFLPKMSTEISKSLSESVSKSVTDLLDAREKDTKTQKSAEESFIFNGKKIVKSIVGEDTYEALFAMQKELATAKYETELRKMEVEVEKSYPNLAGSSSDKAILLMQVNQMPEAVQKLAKEYMEKANASMEKAATETGTSTPKKEEPVSKEIEEQLDKMAKELSEKKGIPFYKAYQEILLSPEGSELYCKRIA